MEKTFNAISMFEILDTRREPDEQVYELAIGKSDTQLVFCKVPSGFSKTDSPTELCTHKLKVIMLSENSEKARQVFFREITTYLSRLDRCGCAVNDL